MACDFGPFKACPDVITGKCGLTQRHGNFTFAGSFGGHSSMVEPQIVVLDVAGSSPVGHPKPLCVLARLAKFDHLRCRNTCFFSSQRSVVLTKSGPFGA